MKERLEFWKDYQKKLKKNHIMKKESMRSRCNLFFLLLGCLLLNLTVNAQIEKTKTVNESFTINKGALVKVNHRKGALHVKRSANDEVKIRMDVLVSGKYEKDVEALLQIFVPPTMSGTGNVFSVIMIEFSLSQPLLSVTVTPTIPFCATTIAGVVSPVDHE